MRAMSVFLFLVAASAVAGADPAPAAWAVGVEPRIGVLVPTSKLGAMAVGGVEVDKPLGPIVLAADLALTRPSYDGSAMDPRIPGGMASYTIHQTELLAGVLASYRFRPERALVPRVGAGPVLQILKSNETTTAAPGENTATQTKLGVEVAGGVDYRLGPGFLAGDVRFVYSKLDTMLTGSSNAGSVSLAFGYRFVF